MSWRSNPLIISVNALGITQITAWGTSYYCLGVLAKPIAAETGWSISTIFLGFSVALVTMGLISTSVGRLIDRIGARLVMSIGTVIVSVGLLGLSQVRRRLYFVAGWCCRCHPRPAFPACRRGTTQHAKILFS